MEIHQKQPDTMWLCNQCGNRMVPEEDKKARKLMQVCKTCSYREPASTNRIYSSRPGEPMRFLDDSADMLKDNTLPHTNEASCPSCGGHNAVFFMDRESQEKGMKLTFLCEGCKHRWKQ